MKEIKKRHIEETVKNIAQTEIGMKVLAKMDETEIAELDTDKIMMKQVNENTSCYALKISSLGVFLTSVFYSEQNGEKELIDLESMVR